jgi:hypothetical protein
MPSGVGGWGAVMRATTWLVVAAGLVLLAACARAPLETEADQAARAFFAAVSGGDWAAVDAALAREAAGAGRQSYEPVRRAIPGGAVGETRVVGWWRTERDGHKRTTAVHLYRYPGVDLVVRTDLLRAPPGNAYNVAGFYLNRLPTGAIEQNRFRLTGMSLRHYAFLAAAVLSPLVMVGMAGLALATPGLRLKPLWAALCFVGVGVAWINWASGEGGFELARLALVNAGAGRATDISPWILRFSAPVGALVVLAKLLLHRPKAGA